MMVMRREKALMLLCDVNSNHSSVPGFPPFCQTVTRPSEMAKASFLRAPTASILSLNGALQLGQPRSHCDIARRLSAPLCPALVINIFLSTQHDVHFAAYRTWNTNDLHLNGQLRQTAWQTGCGWTFLDFLTPWHLCLGCAHVGNDTESLPGKN